MTLFVRSVSLWAIIGALMVPSVLAQSRDGEEIDTQVIHLMNVPLSEISELVEQVYGNELEAITGSEATNSLIIRGTQMQIEKVRMLVSQVDVGRDQSDRITDFIQVRTYPIDELLPLVEQVIGNSLGHTVGSVALDEYNQRLVVTAPKRELELARNFVTQLDRPRQLLTIHVTFLRGEIGAGTGKSESNLPESFKAVAETLKENGLANPTLMAPFTIKTQAGNDFGSISTLEARAPSNKGSESLQFQVKGTVRALTDGEQIELDIESNMKGKIETSDDKMLTPYFELETTLAVPVGKFVVLALAPSSTLSGNAVALVLRVTKE